MVNMSTKHPIPKPTDRITFTLPGAVVNELHGGAWPDENPTGWKCIANAPTQRQGRGITFQVTMQRRDAIDLRFQIQSVIDVLECMTASERGNAPLAALTTAAQRIHTACRTD